MKREVVEITIDYHFYDSDSIQQQQSRKLFPSRAQPRKLALELLHLWLSLPIVSRKCLHRLQYLKDLLFIAINQHRQVFTITDLIKWTMAIFQLDRIQPSSCGRVWQ